MKTKKYFAVILGILAVSSCSQDESVSSMEEKSVPTVTRSGGYENYVFDDPEMAALNTEMAIYGSSLKGDSPQSLWGWIKRTVIVVADAAGAVVGWNTASVPGAVTTAITASMETKRLLDSLEVWVNVVPVGNVSPINDSITALSGLIMVPFGATPITCDSAGWYHNRSLYLFHTQPKSGPVTDNQHLLACAATATGWNHQTGANTYLNYGYGVAYLASQSTSLDDYMNKLMTYYPAYNDYWKVLGTYIEEVSELSGLMVATYTNTFLRSIETNISNINKRNRLKAVINTAYSSNKLWADNTGGTVSM